jgi:hypothetical protein
MYISNKTLIIKQRSNDFEFRHICADNDAQQTSPVLILVFDFYIIIYN